MKLTYPKNIDDAKKWDYKFWNKQDVLKINDKEKSFIDGPINNDNNVVEIPTKLPNEYEWVLLNINNATDLNAITSFINKNYSDDLEHGYKRHYTKEFIKWYYGSNVHKCLGVKLKNDNLLLVGLICGKVIKMQLNKNIMDMIESNFLCIHTKLRQKRLTTVLITELIRLFKMDKFSCGCYASNTYLPTPIISANNFERAINLKLLLSTGLVKLEKDANLQNIEKFHHIPNETTNKNMKKMELIHLDRCYDLFNTYMDKYNYHPIFTKEEFQYIFINNKFVSSYVVCNEDDNVLDFVSYYITQLKNDKNHCIRTGNLYYYTSINETPYRLVKDLLVIAKKNNIDKFTMSDTMENEYITKELLFEQQKTIHHYLYNWKIKPIKNLQASFIPIH